VSIDDFQLLQPAHELVRCSMGLLPGLRPFQRVQHLVALIDPGARLLLARKCNRVCKAADDATVGQPQLGRE
jgi:hypothetical protein